MNNDRKKILILGGINHMVDIVNTAKNMGFYTVVTDYSEHSPAKLIADKSYNISTTDINKLIEICEKENIDGVINGFEDLNVWVACNLCEKLRLPFYATNKQLEIITNKKEFKKYCRQYDLPVVEEYFSGKKFEDIHLSRLEFPVIIKPVDSYGSKGIYVCYNKKEIEENYYKSIQYSKNKSVIIEKFIDSDYGVEWYYTVQNGNIILSAMTDRYVYSQNINMPPLPISTVYQSKYLNKYIVELDKKVRNLIKGMNIINGLVLIQALVENDRFYIYEMAYRLTGEQHYKIIEKQTGVNLLEMMIDLSIGLDIQKYDISKFDNGYIKFPSCNISILLGKGKIKKIVGLEEILKMKEIISYTQTLHEGDIVENNGNYSQMFIRINICAENNLQLKTCIQRINENLKVISEEGKDMILTRFDQNKLEYNEEF